jgi:TonB family protein
MIFSLTGRRGLDDFRRFLSPLPQFLAQLDVSSCYDLSSRAMGQEIRKKIPYSMMVLLFFSSVSCLIVPMPPIIPESAQISSEITCRVLRLTSKSKILQYVKPEYPGNKRKIKTDMPVYLKADVDQEGRVRDAHFFLSDPSFGEAAASAVRQWVFEPILVDGKPVESTHAIEIVFQGKKKEAVANAWLYPDEFRICEMRKQNVKAENPPKLLHEVKPIYPESARLQNIEGSFLLESLFSESGRVEAILLWKSVPYLDEAAIKAFSQWIYEPLIIDNTPYKQVVSIYVRFRKGR